VQFWRSLADVSRPNRWRCQVNALRGGLLAALTLAIAGGSTLMSLAQRDLRTAAALGIGGVLLGVLLALAGALWVHVRWALRQLTLDLSPSRWGWLLALPAPLIALASLILVHGLDLRLEGTLLLFPGLALATARWIRREDGRGFRPRNLIGPGIGMFVPEVGCALVLLLWTTWFLRDRCRRLSIDLPPPASGNTV